MIKKIKDQTRDKSNKMLKKLNMKHKKGVIDNEENEGRKGIITDDDALHKTNEDYDDKSENKNKKVNVSTNQ